MAKSAYVTYLIWTLGVIIQHPDQCYSTQVTADRHCTSCYPGIRQDRALLKVGRCILVPGNKYRSIWTKNKENTGIIQG